MARTLANRVRYLVSLAHELLSQANRVRDLIGDAHWLTDGHHKEYLLIDLLRRHLPKGMIASRGFVIDPVEASVCSREQDILIVDADQEAPVFHQSDVIIAFPRTVRAAISVKTTCSKATVTESVQNLNTLRDIVARHMSARKVWCAAYYFEPDATVLNNPTKPCEYIHEAIRAHPVRTYSAIDPHPSPQGPDLHCTGKEFVYRLNHAHLENETQTTPSKLLAYRCSGYATALMLGNLLDHLAATRGKTDSEFSSFFDGTLFECIGDTQLCLDGDTDS